MEKENKKEKIKKEKKPVTLKALIMRRVIFLVIFLLISVGITAFLIINPFEKEENKSSDKKALSNDVPTAPKRDHKSLIDYEKDTFDYNDLEVTEYEENYEGYDISYFQIDGLKDKEIQDKINKNLINDLENEISISKANGDIKDKFYSYGFCYSSFANTLSIEYSLSSYVYDEVTNEDIYRWEKSVCENYDLTTGKKIQIQDLFTDDTIGSDLFDNSFYNEFVRNYTEMDLDDEEYYLEITDYKDIEEKILEFIIKFNNGEEIPFHFDEQKIVLSECYARIFFDEHLDYLAIYNKYKTNESIFDGTHPKLHDLPVLTKRFNSYYQILDEGENYYIDADLYHYQNYENDEQKILDAIVKYMDSDIKSLKEVDNGKFNIYNYSYTFYETKGVYELQIETAKMETTKSLFKSEVKKQIQDTFRKARRIEGGDEPLYNNQFYYYMYDEDYDYDNVEKDWERETIYVYLDKDGNVYETAEEARNPSSIGIKD